MTAHQRMAIRCNLPEVREVLVVDRTYPIQITTVRLRLIDGSEVAIYGERLNKATRSRIRPDLSERIEDVPIPGEMRRRLEAVFGPLEFRGDPC